MVAKSMMDLFFAFYTPVRPSKVFKPDEDYIKFLKDEYNKYKENFYIYLKLFCIIYIIQNDILYQI